MTNKVDLFSYNNIGYQIGGYMTDGPWVRSHLDFLDNVSIASGAENSYDISSYIPKDGYTYEVLVSVQARTGATAGNSARIKVGNDLSPINDLYIAGGITRVASSRYFGSQALVVIAPSRILKIYNTGNASSSIYVRFAGYRRVGANDAISNVHYIENIDINGFKSSIGSNIYPNKWVVQQLTIWANSSTLGESVRVTASLDDYLPKDDYDYEVIFNGWGFTDSTNGHNFNLNVCSGSNGNWWTYLCRTNTRGAYTEGAVGSTLIPIYANDRNVTLENSGSSNMTIWGLYASAYRRIGKHLI